MNCYTPYEVKTDYREVPVGCGSCPACIRRRISQWILRLNVEERYCRTAHWITLTYAPSHLPKSPNNFPTLMRGKKSHVTLFLKRLRKAHPKGHQKITYFYCGEYGTENKRPHYHMILFNADTKYIQPAWYYGDVWYGDYRAQSVVYSLKYMDKRTFSKRHGRDDRVPEFTMMSKGIGSRYLTKQMVQWHMENENMCCVAEEGMIVGMPRYFKDKIWTLEQRETIGYNTFLKYGKDKTNTPRAYEAALKIQRSNHNFRLLKTKNNEQC